VLLLPKLGEYGSFASFCNSSFLRLALGFLMSYRFFGIVARGPNLSSCDCQKGGCDTAMSASSFDSRPNFSRVGESHATPLAVTKRRQGV
jgi:hypothetical protein